jgi:hypothetical protein
MSHKSIALLHKGVRRAVELAELKSFGSEQQIACLYNKRLLAKVV